MKTFENQARQGDLLITRIKKLPDGLKKVAPESNKHVVAHSETGHHHYVEMNQAVLYSADDPMVSYLEVENKAELKHARSFDTHETLGIPAGTWELRRQREYTPEGWRRVED